MAATYRSTGASVNYTNNYESFVPTLFIGLGGTGKEILQRFRKSLNEEYGSPRTPFAQTLVFDTDMQEGTDIPKGEDAAAYADVRLRADQGEWYTVEIKPDLYEQAKADFTKKNDRRYEKWLHPEFFKFVPEASVRDGSGGYRQAGRLAFFIHYKKIREAIENKLAEMTAYMADANLRALDDFNVETSNLEVVIITSLAGGTGAGMFMDTAYLVRDILSTNPQFRRRAQFDPAGLNSNVAFIGLMPTPYTRKDAAMKERFELNGYSAMLELEHYNTPRPEDNFFQSDEDGRPTIKYRDIQFKVNWDDPSGVEKVIDGRPWHTCYLIDDVNDKNRRAKRELSDVHQMVADYLFMDLGNNQFAIQKRSVRSNHAPLSANMVIAEVHDPNPITTSSDDEQRPRGRDILYENKYGCSYSTYGLAEIYIDPDRMRRCASYRLASQMIRKRLISKDSYGENDYSKWVKEDLYNEDAEAAEKLSFVPNELARAVLRENGHDWITWAEGIFDELEKRDPSNTPIKALEAELRAGLNKIKNLINDKPAAGLTGTIKATLVKRSLSFRSGNEVGPLQERLDRRSRQRVSQIGLLPVLRLLQEYASRLEKSRQEASKWAKRPSPNIDDMLARLNDALRVPMPCKKSAARIEYQATVKEARTETMVWLRNTAAKHLDGIYDDALRYVKKGETDVLHESLYQRYSTWAEFLENGDENKESVCKELDAKFELFRQQPETDRRIPLVPNWKGEDYDAEINASLLIHREIGADTEQTRVFDWNRAVSVILAALEQSNTCALIEGWSKQHAHDADAMPEIIEGVAAASRSALSKKFGMGHFADGNVVNYLIAQPKTDRQKLLQRMIDGSAPYIPSVAGQRSYDPVWRNLLGITAGSDGRGNKDRLNEEIKGISAANSDDKNRDAINDALECSESRLVLLRELAGIPLHYSARLSDLRESYFSSGNREFRMTCHLRYRETAEDLPDIELISNEEYERIANQVNAVVRGILLRFVSCTEDGMFSVRVPDEFQERTYDLGSRINRVVKHACRVQEVRTFLQKRWAKWKDQVATTKHLAVLYNTVQQNLLQFPSTVPAGENEQAVPPIQNCFRKLLYAAEKDLVSAPDGQKYFDVLKRRDTLDSDYDQWKEKFEALSQHIKQTCLVTACDTMPFLQIDESKVEAVEWPS
jgi:hypothetical protein